MYVNVGRIKGENGDDNRSKTFELIAHRGFAFLAPENTMTAFTMAHSVGAHSLECDVQISSDGFPVLIHDATVNRTTNGTGNVKDKTLAQLKLLDAGSKLYGSRFTSSRIPNFDEFLKFSKGRVNKIYPEIKGIRSVADIALIVNPVIDNQMEDMCVIQSFDLVHLAKVRERSKIINFGFLSDTVPTLAQYNELELDGNCSLLLNHTILMSNPSVVSECRRRGIDLGAWTVNTSDDITNLLSIGVNKIMSNLYFGGIVH